MLSIEKRPIRIKHHVSIGPPPPPHIHWRRTLPSIFENAIKLQIQKLTNRPHATSPYVSHFAIRAIQNSHRRRKFLFRYPRYIYRVIHSQNHIEIALPPRRKLTYLSWSLFRLIFLPIELLAIRTILYAMLLCKREVSIISSSFRPFSENTAAST